MPAPNKPAHAPKSETAELIEGATINGDEFDADALFAEFKAKAKRFRFGGEHFELPPPQIWPDSLGKAEELEEVGRIVLGVDQYERYAEAGGTIRFLQELIVKFYGATAGESLASSPS